MLLHLLHTHYTKCVAHPNVIRVDAEALVKSQVYLHTALMPWVFASPTRMKVNGIGYGGKPGMVLESTKRVGRNL